MADKDLIARVVNANRELVKLGLVKLTWGNASAVSDDKKFIFIKPSGISYNNLSHSNISWVDLDGRHLSGGKPSVDTPTHLKIYNGFNGVWGIVHTHSHYATVFAQAKMPIPCLGTTHADYFNGDIPVIGLLKKEGIEQDYEINTGISIVRYFKNNKLNPMKIPAVLVPNHGAFTWGKTIEDALENAYVLEEVAKLAYHTIMLSGALGKSSNEIEGYLLGKHFSRKHGESAYYGQERK